MSSSNLAAADEITLTVLPTTTSPQSSSPTVADQQPEANKEVTNTTSSTNDSSNNNNNNNTNPPSPTKDSKEEPKKRKGGLRKMFNRFFGDNEEERLEQEKLMLQRKEESRLRKRDLMTGASFYSDYSMSDDGGFDGWKAHSVDHEDAEYDAKVSELKSNYEEVKPQTEEKEESESESLTDDDFSDEEDDQSESKNQTFMVSQENEYVQRFIQERREMQSKFSIGEVDRLKLYGQIIDYAMSSVESSEISDRILHVVAFKDRIMFVDEYDHCVEVKFDKRKELKGYNVKKIFLSIPYGFECYVVLENPETETYTHYVIDIDKQRLEQSDREADAKDALTFDYYKFEPKLIGSQKNSVLDGSRYITAMGFPHSIIQDDITTRKVMFMAVSPGRTIYKVDFNVEGEEYDWHINFKKNMDKMLCEEVYNMDTLYNEKQIIIHSHLQGFGIDSIEFAEIKERNEFMAFVSSVAGVAIFTGSGEITDIFDRYGPEQSAIPSFKNYDEDDHLDLEKPKIMHKSVLKIYDSLCFACITAKQVVFGRIYSDSQKTLDKAGKLPHKNPNDVPVDIELNSFHLFVCYKDEFYVIMQPAFLPPSNSRYSLLSKHVLGVRMINTLGVKIDRSIIDKSKEESNQSVYVFNSSKLYRVSIDDQAKGFWRIFLDAALEIEDKDMEYIKSEYFKMALHLSALFDMNSEENRMAIYSAKADHHFKKGDFNTAALDYARTNRNFEEIAMKFMEVDPEDKKNGLYNYLYYMLHRFKNDKKIEECPESVILAVWILELLCFKMNQQRHIMGKFITVACTEDQYREQLEEKTKAEQQLHKIKVVMRKFAYNKKELLAKAKDVVYDIFLSNNFVREFLFFASTIGDYLTIIQHCVTMAKSSEYESNHSKELGYYENAYTILNNFCTEPNAFTEKSEGISPQNLIWYRYTPLLMNYEKRDEIVKSFKRLQFLNPRDLVPAILKYDSITRTQAGQPRRRSVRQEESQVLEYLKWCIEDQKNENRTVHDLFVYLLVNQRNTDLLETYLKETKESENIYFTKEYALRLAIEGRKWKACVLLYRLLELYEEAVDLALDSKVNNVKLAEETVLQFVEDPELKRKLAIKIVKYYVKEENYKKALDLITDFGDVLLLDDVIKYFPSKIQLDELLKDVESILDTYSFQNNRVEVQMRDATNDAELIRNDLSSMNIYYDIDYDDTCERCKSRVLLPNIQDPNERKNYFFYVFPSGQKFHLNCLYRINKHQLKNQLIAIEDKAQETAITEAVNENLTHLEEKKHKKQRKLERLKRSADKAEKESEIATLQMKVKQIELNIQDIKQGRFKLPDIAPIFTQEQADQRNILYKKLNVLEETYENWHKARLELAEAMNDGSEKTQLYWQLEFKNASKRLDEMIGKSCPVDGPSIVKETQIPFITINEKVENEFVI